MNARSFRVLEIDKVYGRLRGYVSSSLGNEMIDELEPMTSPYAIKEAHADLDEMVQLLLEKAGIPFGPVHPMGTTVKKASIGSTLTPREILQVGDTLRTTRVLRRFFTESDTQREKFGRLFGFAEGLVIQSELEKDIEAAILSDQEISDNASPELRTIRRRIDSKNQSIRDRLDSMISSQRYASILQERLITIRDGRFCIPVKNEYKKQIKGMIHDQSASGNTVYVEPMAVVNLNNELRELHIDESKEIERILSVFTDRIATFGTALLQNENLLKALDFLLAKAKLALDMGAVRPEINQRGYLRIVNGRHPSIPVEEVVPTNVWLGDHFKTLLITGPNTGGKTVTLKTVGLLTLMMQSGLFVPADHGTELAIFEKVFADIGDEQSIEQSLSTFSSHMTNIVEILERVDDRSLVLFDELGAGTDPTEGAALAMAILKRLYKDGIRTIATTHYTELKQFAVITEGIENASVEFDVATLSPTYKLLIGVPGKSNAFEISKRLGLSDDLIDEARHLVHHDDIAFEEIIEGIERNRKEAEEDRNDALRLRLDVERLKKSLEQERESLSSQRDQVVKKAKDEARSILKRAKDSADEVMKTLREMESTAKVDQHQLDQAKSRLREELGEVTETVFDREVVNEAPPERVAVGDRVKVLHLGQEGEVLRADEHADEVQVQMGVMKMMVPLNKIEVIGKKTKPAQPQASRRFSGVGRSASTEIDLRGDDLEEARMRLDKFIDEASLSNLKELRIIHGKGTGALRKGVQEYVKRHGQIAEFRDGKYNEGGTGVTVVTLKE